MLALLLTVALGLPQAPVPQPFPRPGATAPASPTPPPSAPSAPSAPRPAPGASDIPTEASLGLPIFPAAQFISSYDAGRGQRYYIFGSGASFMDLVAYYRTALKQKGEMIFDAPATYGFEVGRYREETMAFPPGVTIKDYQTAVSEGFPNPKPGGEPARFRSIIQFVPVSER